MTNRENVETSSNLLSSEKSDTKATTAPPEGRVGIGWRFWVFVAAYFMFNLFQGMLGTYITPILTTLERQFGLPSAKSGVLASAAAIGYLVLVIFVSHFGSKWHKPILFAISAFIEAVAAFVIVLPYLIYGAPGGQSQAGDNINVVVMNNTSRYNISLSSNDMNSVQNMAPSMFGVSPICNHVTGSIFNDSGAATCQAVGVSENEYNPVAFIIIILGVILHGIAMTPVFTVGIAYFVEILGMRKASTFTGFLFFVRYTSPVLCYILASRLLLIYITLEETQLTPYHPKWLGAWWLGFAMFGAGSFVCGVVMVFCPRYLGTRKHPLAENKDNKGDKKVGFFQQFKGINPVMYLLISAGGMMALCWGFLNFLPKYIENQFHQSVSDSSMYAGFGMVLAGAVGNIISGFIALKVRFSLVRVVQCSTLMAVIVGASFAVLIAIECPQASLSGSVNHLDGKYNLTSACNSACACARDYNPVCGSDGVVYYSACHAGCTSVNGTGLNQIFTNCACVEGGSATSGTCAEPCPLTYLYIVIQFISWFIVNLFSVPLINGILGCADNLHGMVMGIYTFIGFIMYFPSPVIFGALIDTTCIVSNENCGKQGACLYYDVDAFRIKLHLAPVFIVIFLVMPFYIAAWVLVKCQLSKEKKNGTLKM